jgi:hypothetical protein
LHLSATERRAFRKEVKEIDEATKHPIDVAVATHKTVDLVFTTQMYKLKREAQKPENFPASSPALRQNGKAEGRDETPAHSSAIARSGSTPAGARAADKERAWQGTTSCKCRTRCK